MAGLGIASEQHYSGHPAELIARLRVIVGRRHVLTNPASTRTYRSGFRDGVGEAVAVVRPQSLVQLWRVVSTCVAADVIVLMQGANTGLTGGSTPRPQGYDRLVVIVSPMAIDAIHVLDGGRQVICLPGATLSRLEARLARYGREPHSVIGSSCIGASVIGGVCNNSGGALVRRGPAFTELALFAQLGADRVLRLINHLGVKLPEEPEAALARIERGDFTQTDVIADPGRASDRDYERHVRDIDAPTPARFNADARGLFEGSGSAGRLVLFAVRLDTFRKETTTTTFCIGTNNPDDLAALRCRLLSDGASLPISAEYLHRDAFDLARVYGKDLYLAIRWFGARRLPLLFAAKARIDAWTARLGGRGAWSDRLLQRIASLLPEHLPKSLRLWRSRFAHILLLKVASGDAPTIEAGLDGQFRSGGAGFFRCTAQEAAAAFRHRFVTAGAAIRYRQIHAPLVEDVLALDVALPRNADSWFETLPAEIADQISHKIYYGHFLCHVFHHDYVVRKGADVCALKAHMLALMDVRGAEYPAEHNVGHLYRAKPALADFYRALDPCNTFNPGIGQTACGRDWGEDQRDGPARTSADALGHAPRDCQR